MECWALHLRLKTEKSKKLEQVLNQICGRLCVLGLFHFIWWKLQFLEKKITLNCWRNLLFYTRYNMGWWPGWGIWRFFGWEFMKLYYRVALLLLRMCWPSTDRARVEIFGQMRLQPFDLIWFVSDWTTVELNVDCSQFTKFGIREICALK